MVSATSRSAAKSSHDLQSSYTGPAIKTSPSGEELNLNYRKELKWELPLCFSSYLTVLAFFYILHLKSNYFYLPMYFFGSHSSLELLPWTLSQHLITSYSLIWARAGLVQARLCFPRQQIRKMAERLPTNYLKKKWKLPTSLHFRMWAKLTETVNWKETAEWTRKKKNGKAYHLRNHIFLVWYADCIILIHFL